MIALTTNHYLLTLILVAAISMAGCSQLYKQTPLRNLGVSDWTCEVSNLAGAIMDNESTMKTYTGGDCAALVAQCRNQDACRTVKSKDKPEYLLVGLDLDDPKVQKLIVDGDTGG